MKTNKEGGHIDPEEGTLGLAGGKIGPEEGRMGREAGNMRRYQRKSKT